MARYTIDQLYAQYGRQGPTLGEIADGLCPEMAEEDGLAADDDEGDEERDWWVTVRGSCTITVTARSREVAESRAWEEATTRILDFEVDDVEVEGER